MLIPTNILIDKRVYSMKLPIAKYDMGSNNAEVSALIHKGSNKFKEGVIYTTLYDLLAALNETVDPEEDYVVTTTVVHLLKTRQVMCTGDLRGYRLICDTMVRTGRVPSSCG